MSGKTLRPGPEIEAFQTGEQRRRKDAVRIEWQTGQVSLPHLLRRHLISTRDFSAPAASSSADVTIWIFSQSINLIKA